MRRLTALVLASTLMVGVAAPAAYAGTGTNVALGLASFAVFNQLLGPLLHPRPAYAVPVATQAVVYTTPTVYTVPAPVVMITPPPPPAVPTVVQYPHGRYELRGDGVTTQYYWVWIPNPPPPPPAAPPPPNSP